MITLESTGRTAPTRWKALSEEFMAKLREGGVYHPLVEKVQRNKDLHLEFRGLFDPQKPNHCPANEAIGIYYKGNSILKLCSNGAAYVHPVFTNGKPIPKLLNSEDVDTYLRLMPDLMSRVANHGKNSMEIEYEQMLIRANNLEEKINSEYIILVNQYPFPFSENGQTRLTYLKGDLLALKWPRLRKGGKNPVGYLTLIEVKYALNPDIRSADLQLKKYYEYMRDHFDSLCEEMQLILRQKLDLGLIRRSDAVLAQLRKLKLSRDIKKSEFILFLVDYNPNSTWKRKLIENCAKLDFSDQIRVVCGGLAMWEQSSETLEAAAERLKPPLLLKKAAYDVFESRVPATARED